MKQTPSQTVGPYLRIGLIYGEGQNILVNDQTSGERITISGCLYDGNGELVLDGLIEIWQADAQGIYPHPNDPRHDQADPHFRGFGRAETRREGQFHFSTIKPGSSEGHAPYINVKVFSRGMLIHAYTRIYFSDEEGNVHDPVLSSVVPDRRQTLIAARQESDNIPTYCFDIHLQGDEETVFFDP